MGLPAFSSLYIYAGTSGNGFWEPGNRFWGFCSDCLLYTSKCIMLQQIFTLSFMTAFLAAAVRLAVPLMYGGIGETIAENPVSWISAWKAVSYTHLDVYKRQPEGVRDIYNGECSQKHHLQTEIRKVFDSYGYEEIETPSLEYFEVFKMCIRDRMNTSKMTCILRLNRSVGVSRVFQVSWRKCNANISPWKRWKTRSKTLPV